MAGGVSPRGLKASLIALALSSAMAASPAHADTLQEALTLVELDGYAVSVAIGQRLFHLLVSGAAVRCDYNVSVVTSVPSLRIEDGKIAAVEVKTVR